MLPIQPLGKLQLYPVAPLTVLAVYVFEDPLQTAEGPVIEVGAGGGVMTVIASV
jgi:hypothetical protein